MEVARDMSVGALGNPGASIFELAEGKEKRNNIK